MKEHPVSKTKRLVAGVGVLAAISVTAACGGGSSGSKSLSLVAYSTPQTVYSKLIPAFQGTSAGKGVTFKQSYGASGSQSRAVIAGQPADVVEFSTEPDMAKLVAAKDVASNWAGNAHKGFVTDSVVVFVVRKGNPKGIHNWSDLTKPGVKIVTPDPTSSGSARWNIMAAYGAQLKLGKTPAQALAFVKTLLQHTVSQPTSGSLATQAFTSGTGDVLLSYENEAIEAQQAGKPVDYVIPKQTILIQNPIAVTSNAGNSKLATSFVNFLYTDPAQKIFAKEGYRPVVSADLNPKQFPTPAQLFTIDDLGGWDKVTTSFFDPDNGSITKLEAAQNG
jgi:sulfate/thiosulfate transport system substrate-binding protein